MSERVVMAEAVMNEYGVIIRVLLEPDDKFERWEMDKYGWRVVPVEIVIKEDK